MADSVLERFDDLAQKRLEENIEEAAKSCIGLPELEEAMQSINLEWTEKIELIKVLLGSDCYLPQYLLDNLKSKTIRHAKLIRSNNLQTAEADKKWQEQLDEVDRDILNHFKQSDSFQKVRLVMIEWMKEENATKKSKKSKLPSYTEADIDTACDATFLRIYTTLLNQAHIPHESSNEDEVRSFVDNLEFLKTAYLVTSIQNKVKDKSPLPVGCDDPDPPAPVLLLMCDEVRITITTTVNDNNVVEKKVELQLRNMSMRPEEPNSFKTYRTILLKKNDIQALFVLIIKMQYEKENKKQLDDENIANKLGITVNNLWKQRERMRKSAEIFSPFIYGDERLGIGTRVLLSHIFPHKIVRDTFKKLPDEYRDYIRQFFLRITCPNNRNESPNLFCENGACHE